VVRGNLVRSFPDKNISEIQEIEKKFYRHLGDIFLESLKLFSISEKQLRKRFVKRNPEVMNHFYEEGKSVIVVASHYNNWEMAGTSFSFDTKHTILGIYNPFRNKFFDKITVQSRSKFGAILTPMNLVLRYMARYKQEVSATVFGLDQNPSSHKNIYWIPFLNQETPWFVGAERYARKFNYPVIYAHFIKVKRGYFEMEFEVMEENPGQTKEQEITNKYVRHLERIIREQPEYWLWTHRRWKRKREAIPDAG
jgi:KDO2-lipid IV(A) lauroyltransferase